MSEADCENTQDAQRDDEDHQFHESSPYPNVSVRGFRARQARATALVATACRGDASMRLDAIKALHASTRHGLFIIPAYAQDIGSPLPSRLTRGTAAQLVVDVHYVLRR